MLITLTTASMQPSKWYYSGGTIFHWSECLLTNMSLIRKCLVLEFDMRLFTHTCTHTLWHAYTLTCTLMRRHANRGPYTYMHTCTCMYTVNYVVQLNNHCRLLSSQNVFLICIAKMYWFHDCAFPGWWLGAALTGQVMWDRPVTLVWWLCPLLWGSPLK